MELQYNPNVESQAIARMWQEGQQSDVKIFRLICNTGIDSRVLAIQKAKLDLALDYAGAGSGSKVAGIVSSELKKYKAGWHLKQAVQRTGTNQPHANRPVEIDLTLDDDEDCYAESCFPGVSFKQLSYEIFGSSDEDEGK